MDYLLSLSPSQPILIVRSSVCFPVGLFFLMESLLASLFRFNMYTAPAYFMATIIACVIGVMVLYFRDRVRLNIAKDKKKKSQKRAAIDEHASKITFIGLTVYDCCILGCMLLNVSTKGSISSFETLGISLAESHFDMPSARAGTIVASCGTVGVIALLSMGHLTTILTDIQLVSSGMMVMAAGVLSLCFIEENDDNPSWRFSVAIFMIYAVGYPIGHTAVIGMFSKSKCSIDKIFQACLLVLSVTTLTRASSCRTSTSGYTIGLVRLSRIIGSNDISCHVRLRGKLSRSSFSVLHPRHGTRSFHRFCSRCS